MTDTSTPDSIRKTIEDLATYDTHRAVFGAGMHNYILKPTIDPTAIAAFETQHGVQLPADYTRYLTEVANGGAGPAYGLSPLQALEMKGFEENHVVISDGEGNELASAGTPPRQSPELVSSVARPFPLTDKWAYGDSLPDDATPWDGSVHLADQGCGYFDFLVVNGERAGEVWCDYTAGDGEIVKVADSFSEWFRFWLDGATLEWIEKSMYDIYCNDDYPHPFVEYARPRLEKKLSGFAQWSEGWRALGYAHLHAGDQTAALEAFKKAAEVGQQEPKVRFELDLARIAFRFERWEEALRHLQAALAEPEIWHATKQTALFESTYALDLLERVDEANALFETICEMSYFHFDDHFELALRYLDQGSEEKARATLQRLIDDNIGPDRNQTQTTAEMVNAEFARYLQDLEATEVSHVKLG